MSEVELDPLTLEQVREPLPAEGGLECDLRLASQLGEDGTQRPRVVRQPAREQLQTLIVERGDVRGPAMQVDPDVDHGGLLSDPELTTSAYPRGRTDSGGPPRHDINQAVSACALGGERAHLGSNARRPLPNGCQPGKLEVCTGACTRRPADVARTMDPRTLRLANAVANRRKNTWKSAYSGRSRKPLRVQALRGFQSLPLRSRAGSNPHG
jgi:hypothetical protein